MTSTSPVSLLLVRAQVVFQHRADGLPAEHFIDFIYLPWRGTSGEIEGILLHGVDVTERKRAEEKLRGADRRKDEFLAMLAHELRNPLGPSVLLPNCCNWSNSTRIGFAKLVPSSGVK
jgi:signal transduction histidine kinase